MKKSELRKILKPLIKECINEAAEVPYPRGHSTGVDDGKREADDAEQKARLGDALEAVLEWTLAGVSEEVVQAARELYWYEEWPEDVAEGNELEVALEKFGGERSFREDVRLELKYGLLQRQKAAAQMEEGKLKKYKGKKSNPPCKSVEKGLVAGEEGGVEECPDEKDSQQEATGFDKDFGDEFEYLFVESEKEDEDDTDDVDDDASMGNPVPYLEEDAEGDCEEEPAIVVTVGEGLYDKRNKLLHERLIKWSSK